MAGRIPQDFINELVERVDLVEVVRPHVALKRAGKDWAGLCPFHDEKTPSFNVIPAKNFYYCHGCGATGSALKFLMEHVGMGFVEAIEALAAQAGMEVPRDSADVRREDARKPLFETLELGRRFFQARLREPSGRVAIDYLQGRGISGESARAFAIGWAPDDGTALLNALGPDEPARRRLLDAGLIGAGEDGRRRYDRFRGRVIFPIRDIRGRTLAFGGRIIGDGKPKYLNSPETAVFHKSRELYGLYENRERFRRLSRLVFVEGYLDVISLMQAGIEGPVATLGTSVTAEHVQRAMRTVDRLVFCFDGDAAGRRAAWKAVNQCLPVLRDGIEVGFLLLPEGEDPDSLVRREGAEKFDARLMAATPLSDFFFDVLTEGVAPTRMEERSALASRALPLLAQLPESVLRALMFARLAELTAVPVAVLQQQLAVTPPARPQPATADDPGIEPAWQDYDPVDEVGDDAPPDAGFEPPVQLRRGGRVESLLQLLIRNPECAAELDVAGREWLDGQSDPEVAVLVRVIDRLEVLDTDSPAVALAGFMQAPALHELLTALLARPLVLPKAGQRDDLLERFALLLSELRFGDPLARLQARIRAQGGASPDDLRQLTELKQAQLRQRSQ